ncbi:NINE protein [Clostridium algidicarnis]|uniref:tellurite resistance TerB C-terminal domain-containing protein n=1 Tax=Clostridium algidicarnis TaxID=37659 RepID=UPI001CF557CA|nr:tellurite resistance TerB C-terminal domain-containing protein [Clostridium algidicarnis]MCB2285731.1 NINE protein [Clostridium algidicarnis]
MKCNRRTSYFISTMEFKEIDKKPFIAGVLSIILGMFGVHRFYLKRKLTGFIFLMISIGSLEFGKGNLAVILMFISIIEGMVYIVRGLVLLKEKITNIKTKKDISIEELESVSYGEKDRIKIKDEKVKTSEKEDEDELEIIEISKIEPSKIIKENESGNIFKGNWIKKLNISYDRSIMKVYQVKEESLNLYENLCNFIDKELKSGSSSLNKEARRIEIDNGYYNNIFYTIYCISEGHVTKTYSGNYNYYNQESSYRMLEEHLGNKLKDKVFNKAKELEGNISFPNSETLKYFNLTETGLPIEWWDKDGNLRLEREFNKDELNILRATPLRSTKVWELYKVKKEIIELYLEIWKTILNSFKKDLEWKHNNKDILEKIKKGGYEYFADYENGNILASLIKVSENEIREVMPNTQILNLSKEKNNINKYLPSELVEDINNKTIEYKNNMTDENLKGILKEMLENDSNDWRLKVEEVLIEDDYKRIDKLIDYSEDENFIRMAKEIIEKTNDEKLLLLCLYGIGKEENLNQKNIKLLEYIIHSSNISVYKSIVQFKEVLSLELLDRLLELKKPIRKKIELDMDKVKDSKKELNETVDIIKEYIGDEEEAQKIDVVEKIIEGKDDEKLEFKYAEFLKLVLDKGSINVEEGKKIAMDNGTLLNAFISDVNQKLYEYIKDQTIIIEGNYIKIDDFYVDMVKELVINEE